MTNWVLTATASDLTSQGTVHNVKALSAADGSGTILDITLAGGATGSAAWYTEPNVPNLTEWPAGDYTISFDVDAAGADITYTLSLHRVWFNLVDQQETIGTSGTLSGTGLKSFTFNVGSPITPNSAADRFVGKITASRGASHGNQTLTISVNGVNDLLIMPDPPANIDISVPEGALLLTGQNTSFDITHPVDAGIITLAGFDVVIDVNAAIEIPEGSLVLTGQDISFDESYPVDTLALSIIGQEPTLNIDAGFTIGIPEGNLTLISLEETLEFGYDIPTGTLQLVGNDVSLDINIPIDSGLIQTTIYEPTLFVEHIADVQQFEITLTSQAVALEFEIVVPDTSLTLTGQDVWVEYHPVESGNLVLTGFDVSATIGFSIIVDNTALALEGQAPVVEDYWTDTGTLDVVGYANSLDFGNPVGSGITSIEGHLPTIEISIVFEPDSSVLALIGIESSLEFVFATDTNSLELSGYSPFTGNVNVDVGSLALVGETPSIITSFEVLTGSIELAGQEPALELGLITHPGVVALVLDSSTTSFDLDIAIEEGGLLLETTTSFISEIAIPTAELTLIGYLPLTTGNIEIDVEQGSLNLVGYVPVIRIIVTIEIDSSAISISTYDPSLIVFGTYYPGLGNFNLTGYSPVIEATEYPTIQRYRVRTISLRNVLGEE